MTAIEELRRMLDERRVEYRWDNGTATWYVDGVMYNAWGYDNERLTMSVCHLTPEQAIAATLGPCSDSCSCTNGERTGERMETCEMEYVSDWMSWHCKSCDQMDMAPRNPKPRYCKWCGRKVVDDG